MNAYVTYLISDASSNVLFVQRMMARGYTNAWASNGKTYKLPPNSMWKFNTTLEQAMQDAQQSAKEAYAVLSNLIIVPATPWMGIEGI